MATYLFSEMPYAAALAEGHLHSRCSNCFAVGSLQCEQACGEIVYCSEECMETDRPWHVNECHAYRNGMDSKELPSYHLEVRLLGRLLTRRKADNGRTVLSTDFPSHLAKDRRFDDLISHDRDFEKLPRSRSTCETLHGLFVSFFNGTPLADVKFRELVHFYNICKINGFSVAFLRDGIRGEFAHFGEGVYLNASRFNHSCRPSLLFSFDGCRLIVKKVQKMENGSGLGVGRCESGQTIQAQTDQRPMTKKEFSKQTFSYGFTGTRFTVPLTWERIDSLKRRYFFQCQCELCRDRRTTELQANASPMKCPRCGQPYVWKEKLLSPKMTLKKSCKCRIKADVAWVSKGEDTQTQLKTLDEKWNDSPEECLELGERYWHSVYNLRFGQLNELIMNNSYSYVMRLRQNSQDQSLDGEQLQSALAAAERMLKSYTHYAAPYSLSMAFLFHRVASMYLMQEGKEIEKRRRACELYVMAARVWKCYGEPKCEKYVIELSELLQEEIATLATTPVNSAGE